MKIAQSLGVCEQVPRPPAGPESGSGCVYVMQSTGSGRFSCYSRVILIYTARNTQFSWALNPFVAVPAIFHQVAPI